MQKVRLNHYSFFANKKLNVFFDVSFMIENEGILYLLGADLGVWQ